MTPERFADTALIVFRDLTSDGVKFKPVPICGNVAASDHDGARPSRLRFKCQGGRRHDTAIENCEARIAGRLADGAGDPRRGGAKVSPHANLAPRFTDRTKGADIACYKLVGQIHNQAPKAACSKFGRHVFLAMILVNLAGLRGPVYRGRIRKLRACRSIPSARSPQ